jgi:hypothetical protein
MSPVLAQQVLLLIVQIHQSIAEGIGMCQGERHFGDAQ